MNIGVNERASAINQMYVGVDGVARLVYSSGGGGGDFQLPTFSGSSSVFGDANEGRIELYESGTLVLFPGNYDVFLVGGGSSGSFGTDGSMANITGGGGSGYTSTHKGLAISNKTEYDVVIGAGGNRSSGGKTTFVSASASISYEVNGGSVKSDTTGAGGGNGGSGGGGYNPSGNGGAGGSDGGDGSGRRDPGSGQGTTTRMFEEAESTLYAGGGGAGAYRDYSVGSGGAGGGGAGGTNKNGTDGTANTGGGGGGYADANTSATINPGKGGSGIVIIRWGTAPTLSDTFGDNSWENIVWACNNNAVPDTWAIGDKKFLQVGSENIEVAIADKNHDDLPDGGKAALTFTMTGITTTERSMNNSNTNTGSFYGSNMYSYLKDTILPQFPEVVKNNVKTVVKRTSQGNKSTAIRTDNMPIWLFSAVECGLSGNYVASDEGTAYPYYTNTTRQKGNEWWLRSPVTNSSTSFCFINITGTLYIGLNGDAGYSNGVSFGFCI